MTGVLDRPKRLSTLVEPLRLRSGLQLFDPSGDLLPGSDALLIVCERERADLLGNV